MFSMDKSKLFSLLVFSLTLILIIPGCGGSGGNGGGGGNGTGKILSVKVTPAEVTLAPGGTQKFEATLSTSGTISTAVTWSVVPENGGTIDENGLYTAPPDPGEYYVKATSVADQTKSAQAKVTVVDSGTGEILSVKVTPKTVTLLPGGTQQFEASVSATGTISTAVIWSVITPNGGTIDQTGFYRAPLVAGEYYIKATSVADPTKSDQAKVIVAGAGGGMKQYKGEIFINNTGTGTVNETRITIKQQASLKVTIPEVDPEAERPLELVLQVDEVTASIDDFQGNDNGWLTIKGSVSSAKMDWYILLIIKEDTYDLWVGAHTIPCQYTNSDGFTMEESYQFMGKYITDYELPADPSRLTGSISEKMTVGYPFVTQEVTWDLETSL